MARAPVSKTGGWGFESLHSCQLHPRRALPLGIKLAKPLILGYFLGNVLLQP